MASKVQPSSHGSRTHSAPRKRQTELMVHDCKRLCCLEHETPFKDVFDAVERLLPFHLLHSEEGCAADVDETENGSGANLMWSRHEAWEDMCLQKSADFALKSREVRKKIEALEHHMQSPSRAFPEEQFGIEKLLSQDVHDRYVTEKANSAKAFQAMAHQMMVPTPPPTNSQPVNTQTVPVIPQSSNPPNPTVPHSTVSTVQPRPLPVASVSGRYQPPFSVVPPLGHVPSNMPVPANPNLHTNLNVNANVNVNVNVGAQQWKQPVSQPQGTQMPADGNLSQNQVQVSMGEVNVSGSQTQGNQGNSGAIFGALAQLQAWQAMTGGGGQNQRVVGDSRVGNNGI